MQRNSVLLLLLLHGSLYSLAQTAPQLTPTPHYRWEAGLQLAAYAPVVIENEGYPYMAWPVMPTVRYYFGNQLSLETGLLLNPTYRTIANDVWPYDNDISRRMTTRFTAWSVPVVLRWQRPAGHWKLAAEAGLLFVSGQYRKQTDAWNSKTNEQYPRIVDTKVLHDVPLLLGINASYPLTPHWSFTASLRGAWSYRETLQTYNESLFERLDRQKHLYAQQLSPALSAGLMYSFGVR